MQVRREPAQPHPGADYSSTFVASPVHSGEARAWAAAVFGGAPAPFRLALRLGWRFGLRLRLDGSADLLGWPTDGDAAEPGPDTARLVAVGALVAARNIIERPPGELRWTTTVAYRSWLGRLLWTLAAPVHHLTIPWLIRHAAREVSR